MKTSNHPLPWRLIVGDVITYLLVTLIGFSSHDTLALGSLPRMLATFIPFTVSWFVVAPWLGIFDDAFISRRFYFARVLLATTLTAPVGAFLRGLWLGTPILPTFVLVMMAMTSALMVAWRLVHRFVKARIK